MAAIGSGMWRRACAAGQALDLLHARVSEPYAPHVHEEYAVGACTAGREVIRYRGTLHYAGPGSVVVLEPGEAHTGAPADPPDFTYCAGCTPRWAPGCRRLSRWRPNRGCPGCWESSSAGTPRRHRTSRCAARAGWPGW